MNKTVRNTLIATGITLASLYAANKLINKLASKSLKTPDEIGSHFINWRYGRIHYLKKGKGSPIILIHDIDPRSSSFEWIPVMEHLSKTNCVYAIDLMGCGLSDRPNMTYTNYMFVQLITDFIKNVVGEKSSIVACKSSVSFTIMACNMNPECFDKLILEKPTNPEDLAKMPSKNKNVLKYLLDSPIVGTFIYNIINSRANIEASLDELTYRSGNIKPKSLINEYYANAHNGDSHGKYLNSSIKSHYTNINIEFAIKKINNSISVISGEKDLTAASILEKYKALNPLVEGSIIKDAGKLPHVENPEEFANNVKVYL